MNQITAWLEAHPWVDVAAIVVFVSTILDRALPHVSPETARILRPLRWLVDLLSMLPSKGHSLRGGLQVPGLSWSGPPSEKPGPGPGIALLVVLALLGGCVTARANSIRTLDALEVTSGTALLFVHRSCGKGGELHAPACEQGDADACKRFERCHRAMLAIRALEGSILGAKLALQAQPDNDGAALAQASGSLAIEIGKMIGDWR